MGFSIGRFLGKIAGPVIGGLIGGPPGAAVGGAISAGFADEPAQAASIGRATQPGPVSTGPLVGPAQFSPGFTAAPTSIGPTFASLARLPQILGTGAGALALQQSMTSRTNGGSPISIILAKARRATGGTVTRNKIIDAAKFCGLETAANTFGLDTREVCLVVVKGRSRRRRGVSAADIRRTKRTIGFASKIRKDLKVLAK